jgi:hypothetical protein
LEEKIMAIRTSLAPLIVISLLSTKVSSEMIFRLSYEWGPDVGFLITLPVKFSLEWRPDQNRDYYIGLDCSMQPLVWINQIGTYGGSSWNGILAEEKINFFNFVSSAGDVTNTISHTPKIGFESHGLFIKGGPNFLIADNRRKNHTFRGKYLNILDKNINLEAGMYFK